MDHPCTSNKWEVQELSLQFSDPRVSLLPGFQATESWPVQLHIQVLVTIKQTMLPHT